MPKGSNPNSRANLEKGKATRFRKGDTRGKREAAMASNKAQAERKTFAETLRTLLMMELTDNNGHKVTTREAISTALIKKALSGNIAAYSEIRDTLGEKAPETNVIIQSADPADIKKSVKEVKDLLGEL